MANFIIHDLTKTHSTSHLALGNTASMALRDHGLILEEMKIDENDYCRTFSLLVESERLGYDKAILFLSDHLEYTTVQIPEPPPPPQKDIHTLTQAYIHTECTRFMESQDPKLIMLEVKHSKRSTLVLFTTPKKEE